LPFRDRHRPAGSLAGSEHFLVDGAGFGRPPAFLREAIRRGACHLLPLRCLSARDNRRCAEHHLAGCVCGKVTEDEANACPEDPRQTPRREDAAEQSADLSLGLSKASVVGPPAHASAHQTAARVRASPSNTRT